MTNTKVGEWIGEAEREEGKEENKGEKEGWEKKAREGEKHKGY